MGNAINYVGKTFNFLEVLDQKREKKRTYIYCKCLRCGNKKWIRSDIVVSGRQVSCGCYKIENAKKDITDKKFGRLTAKYDTGKRAKDNGSVIWFCECECGNTKEVSQQDITLGRTTSCGCVAKEWQSKHGKELGKKTLEYCVDGTNIRNLTMQTPARNTSGHKGVIWDKSRNKWSAQINFKGKNYYLGRYDDMSDAIKIRKLAEENIFGEFLEWFYKTFPEKNKKEHGK